MDSEAKFWLWFMVIGACVMLLVVTGMMVENKMRSDRIMECIKSGGNLEECRKTFDYNNFRD